MGNVSHRPATTTATETTTATVDFIFSVATKEKLQQQQLMHEQMSFRARRHTKKGRGKRYKRNDSE